MADANPTIFEQAWSYQIGGVPVVQLLVVAGVIYLFYIVIFKRGGHKLPVYKKREWNKEVKTYNYEDLNIGFPVNQVLHFRYPQGFIMMATIHNGKARIEKNPKDGKPIIKFDDTNEHSWKLKVRKLGLIGKLLGWLGFGIKFWAVDEKNIQSQSGKEFRINPLCDYDIDSGVVVIGGVSKGVVENISYIKHNENISESIINKLPQTEFFNQVVGAKVAEMREQAEIEKEKYKGQTDE